MNRAVRDLVVLKKWTPRALGASLFGYWDAENLATLTLSGANVTTWADLVGGYAATQATSGFKPAWSASGFGSRAGINFDGTDDYLEFASPPFPAGSAGSEIWVLVRQDALAADTTTRQAAGYGSSGNTMRQIERVVTSGVNRARSRTGDGASGVFAANASIDFSGYHLARAAFSPTQTSFALDGTALVSSSVVPGTTATRLRIGAGSSTSPSGFWQGSINAVLVTGLLSDAQAAQLTAYFKSRGGIA